MQRFTQNSDTQMLGDGDLDDAHVDHDLESPTRSRGNRMKSVKRKLFAEAPVSAPLEESPDLTLASANKISPFVSHQTETAIGLIEESIASSPSDPFTDTLLSPKRRGRKSIPASLSAMEFTPKPKKSKKFVVPTISPPTSSSSPKRDSCVPDLRPRSSKKQYALFQDRRVIFA